MACLDVLNAIAWAYSYTAVELISTYVKHENGKGPHLVDGLQRTRRDMHIVVAVGRGRIHQPQAVAGPSLSLPLVIDA